MTKPIQKLRQEWDHVSLMPEVVDTINALIDAVEALEKRVEGVEDMMFCNCGLKTIQAQTGLCVNCHRKVKI